MSTDVCDEINHDRRRHRRRHRVCVCVVARPREQHRPSSQMHPSPHVRVCKLPQCTDLPPITSSSQCRSIRLTPPPTNSSSQSRSIRHTPPPTTSSSQSRSIRHTPTPTTSSKFDSAHPDPDHLFQVIPFDPVHPVDFQSVDAAEIFSMSGCTEHAPCLMSRHGTCSVHGGGGGGSTANDTHGGAWWCMAVEVGRPDHHRRF